MSDLPVSFGVVGFGRIGQRHAAIVAGHPESQLTAVVDCDATLAPRVRDQYGVPFYTSLDQLLADPARVPEVINICTPNHLHAPQAIAALRAGAHVVIEKPMALHRAEGEAVLYEALQRHRLAFCVMQNRYSPPAVWLKEMVSSGRLGQIFFVQINCYWNRDARYYQPGGWKGQQATDGGTLFTQFSHFVDMLYWLFGDVHRLSGRFYDFNHADLTEFEDSGSVQFELVRGGAGVLNYSTSVWGQNLESSLIVLAERGSLRVGGQYMEEVTYCHVQDYQMPTLPAAAPPNDYGAYKGSAANHHFVIENVVNTLRQRTVATTNALEGLKVVDIIERMYALRTSPKG